MRHLHPRLLSIIGCLLLATSARAASMGQIEISLSVEAHPEWDWSTTKTGEGEGTGYTVPDDGYTPGSYPESYSITWDTVAFDTDPFVSGNFAITNNSGVTQIFTLTIDIPVLALPSTLMYGTSAISLLDADASGAATLAALSGDALFYGTHGAPLTNTLALYAFPYSLDVNTALGSNIDNQSLGVFPGTIPGPAVNSTIGIRHRFSLTAGDRATFNSAYSVVVPEPETAALLLFGLGALALRHRRG